MKVPAGYDGPAIEIVLKDSKAENLQVIIDTMVQSHLGSAKKIGMFLKNEEEDGDLSKVLIQRLNHFGK